MQRRRRARSYPDLELFRLHPWRLEGEEKKKSDVWSAAIMGGACVSEGTSAKQKAPLKKRTKLATQEDLTKKAKLKQLFK